MDDISIVVVSCEKFKDTWRIMHESLKLIPRNQEVKVYWITDGDFPFKSEDEGVFQIKLGTDEGWVYNLKSGLEKIESEYILYLQDDFFLTKKHPENWLNDVLGIVQNNDLDYYRVFPPYIGVSENDRKVNLAKYSDNYALCLRPSLWLRSSFIRLLSSELNPWEFERQIKNFIKGNSIQLKIGSVPFDYCNQLHINTLKHTAIHKGYWTREAYAVYGDLLLRSSTRKLEGKFRTYLYSHNLFLIRPFTKMILRLLVRLKINI